jgi:CBS domain-containing protein
VDYATFQHIYTVDWNKTVSFALQRMKTLHRSCLFVVNKESDVIGIVTEHDDPSSERLEDFCKRREMKFVKIEDAKMTSREAAKYMLENNFHRIIIKDGDNVGIFTSTDFIRMVAEGY